MSSRDATQLDSITRLAEHAEQECARKLSEIRKRLTDKVARIEQLKQYQDEYAEQGRMQNGQSMHVSALSGRAAFLTRLQEAITHETEQYDILDTDLKICLQRWQAAHAHAEAMRTLQDKQAREVSRRHARREQTIADEHATSKRGTRS